MYINILIIALLIAFALLCKTRTIKAVHIRTLVLPLAGVIFILCLVFLSNTAVKAAYKGLKLWLDIVFPSLFPFFVASEFLNGTGFVRAMGVLLEPLMRPLFNIPGCGSFAFLMGITSGYPVGARISAELHNDKLIKTEEAERLLAFSNNSGPLFIIGAVSIGMFKMPSAGIFLLICHILACITVGVLLMLFSSKGAAVYPKRQVFARFKHELFCTKSQKSIGCTFGDAVRNSVMTMLMIGGFIIFFSVIINLLVDTGLIHQAAAALSSFLCLLKIDGEIVESVISGVFEITTGADMASKATGASLTQQLMAASLIIGWGGLSVHSQVLSIVHGSGIRMKTYLLGKLLQGILASIYVFIGIKTAGSLIFTDKPAFFPFEAEQSATWYRSLAVSLECLLVFAALFAALAILSAVISLSGRSRKLRKSP